MARGEGPSRKAPGKGQSDIFSDDDEEKKFIDDVGRIDETAWISSAMQWNTIHRIPWTRCDELGRGTFGAVYLAMREDNKLFAVKSIKMEYPINRKIAFNINCQIMEIKMMRLMKCKYIIRCLGCGRSNGKNRIDSKDTLDVFLEYVARGSLKHVIKMRKKTFEENPYARQYTYDILKALQYMRRLRVIHGDIKMSNLLLSDDCVKLADWGGSKQLRKDNLNITLIGTTGFQSPEVIKNEQQSYPADIFSLGCTVIEMITGHAPNDVLKVEHNFAAMDLNPVYCPEIPKRASPQCQDFLKLCLCSQPEDRWTAAELLHHPFITNRDKTNMLPYGMPLPKLVNASLLQPPRRNHLELPNDLITNRVYRHLTGVLQSWTPNLMGCAPYQHPLPTLAPLNQESPPGQAPAPLPPFSPNLTIKEDTKLHDELVRALSKPAVKKSEVQEEARDKVRQVKFNPFLVKKEFVRSLKHSKGLMDGLNNDIYAEARKAARQPLPEDDGPGSLFPHLARSRARQGGPDVAQDSCCCTLGDVMSCRSDGAIDALLPGKRKKCHCCCV